MRRRRAPPVSRQNTLPNVSLFCPYATRLIPCAEWCACFLRRAERPSCEGRKSGGRAADAALCRADAQPLAGLLMWSSSAILGLNETRIVRATVNAIVTAGAILSIRKTGSCRRVNKIIRTGSISPSQNSTGRPSPRFTSCSVCCVRWWARSLPWRSSSSSIPFILNKSGPAFADRRQ